MTTMRLLCKAEVDLDTLRERLSDTSCIGFDAHCIADCTLTHLLVVLPRCRNITHLSLKNASLEKDSRLFQLCHILSTSAIVFLDLSYNFLQANQINVLCNALALARIETLDLSRNLMRSKGLRILARALPHLELRDLSVESNEIGDSGFRAFIKALRRTNKLRCLALARNARMTASTLQEFSSVLIKGQVRELSLSIDANAINAFNVAMQHPACQLESLGLFNLAVTLPNQLLRFMDPSLFGSFLRALSSENCKVSNLGLLGFPLGHESVRRLCVTVLQCAENNPLRQFTKLNLSNTYMGTRGAKAVAAMLRNELSSSLIRLELPRNFIGNRGVASISHALASPHCRIEHLDLTYNLVAQNTVYSLARKLRQPHCRITELRLMEVIEDDDTQDDDDDDETAARIGPSFYVIDSTMYNMRLARICLALRSAKQVPRIGTKSAMRRLPHELVRLVAAVLEH